MTRAASRWIWFAAVGALMLVAFAVGAYIASRTELFPPQVDAAADVVPDPSGEPSPSPEPEVQRWRGTFTSRTEQWYREGVCRTPWAGAVVFTVGPGGVVEGRGRVGFGGTSDCAVPAAQQVRSYTFAIDGLVDGRGLTMRWRRFVPRGGTIDLGGFGPTIADRGVTLAVALDADDGGRAQVRLRRNTAAGVPPARSETDLRVGCSGSC
jgi:hypothetical protein